MIVPFTKPSCRPAPLVACGNRLRAPTSHSVDTAGRKAYRPQRFVCNSSADAATSPSHPAVSVMQGEHVLICIADDNEYLSDASKEAMATGCRMVQEVGGKLTVYIADMKANLKEEDQAAHQKQMESVVEWHLGDKGVTNFTIHLDAKPDCVAASMGDVADDQKADMVVLSTAAIHAKYVDANLLAEFCPCATLLIP